MLRSGAPAGHVSPGDTTRLRPGLLGRGRGERVLDHRSRPLEGRGQSSARGRRADPHGSRVLAVGLPPHRSHSVRLPPARAVAAPHGDREEPGGARLRDGGAGAEHRSTVPRPRPDPDLRVPGRRALRLRPARHATRRTHAQRLRRRPCRCPPRRCCRVRRHALDRRDLAHVAIGTPHVRRPRARHAGRLRGSAVRADRLHVQRRSCRNRYVRRHRDVRWTEGPRTVQPGWGCDLGPVHRVSYGAWHRTRLSPT